MSGLEVIGSVASVLQLAATVYSISKTLYEVGGALSNAPSEIKDLARDLETFSEELNLLSSLLSDKTHRYSDQVYRLTAKIIGDCASICVKIDRILRKLRSGSFLSRVKWVFKEKEIMKLLVRLRDLKLSLMSTLSLLSALKADHLMDAMGVGKPSLLERSSEKSISKETEEQVAETRRTLTNLSKTENTQISLFRTDSENTLVPSVSQNSVEAQRSLVSVKEEAALPQTRSLRSLAHTSLKRKPRETQETNPFAFISTIALPPVSAFGQLPQAMESVESFHSALSRHDLSDNEISQAGTGGSPTSQNSVITAWRAEMAEVAMKTFKMDRSAANIWAAGLPLPDLSTIGSKEDTIAVRPTASAQLLEGVPIKHKEVSQQEPVADSSQEDYVRQNVLKEEDHKRYFSNIKSVGNSTQINFGGKPREDASKLQSPSDVNQIGASEFQRLSEADLQVLLSARMRSLSSPSHEGRDSDDRRSKSRSPTERRRIKTPLSLAGAGLAAGAAKYVPHWEPNDNDEPSEQRPIPSKYVNDVDLAPHKIDSKESISTIKTGGVPSRLKSFRYRIRSERKSSAKASNAPVSRPLPLPEPSTIGRKEDSIEYHQIAATQRVRITKTGDVPSTSTSHLSVPISNLPDRGSCDSDRTELERGRDKRLIELQRLKERVIRHRSRGSLSFDAEFSQEVVPGSPNVIQETYSAYRPSSDSRGIGFSGRGGRGSGLLSSNSGAFRPCLSDPINTQLETLQEATNCPKEEEENAEEDDDDDFFIQLFEFRGQYNPTGAMTYGDIGQGIEYSKFDALQMSDEESESDHERERRKQRERMMMMKTKLSQAQSGVPERDILGPRSPTSLSKEADDISPVYHQRIVVDERISPFVKPILSPGILESSKPRRTDLQPGEIGYKAPQTMASFAQRSKYQFEAGSEDDEMENEIESDLDALGKAAGRLNALARATGKEGDEQNKHFDRIATKVDRVDDQIALNRARLDRINQEEVTFSLAAAYKEDVGGPVTPLAAGMLRKQQKRESNLADESDYKKSATTRATRSSAYKDDDSRPIVVTGKVRVMVGNTKLPRDGLAIGTAESYGLKQDSGNSGLEMWKFMAEHERPEYELDKLGGKRKETKKTSPGSSVHKHSFGQDNKLPTPPRLTESRSIPEDSESDLSEGFFSAPINRRNQQKEDLQSASLEWGRRPTGVFGEDQSYVESRSSSQRTEGGFEFDFKSEIQPSSGMEIDPNDRSGPAHERFKPKARIAADFARSRSTSVEKTSGSSATERGGRYSFTKTYDSDEDLLFQMSEIGQDNSRRSIGNPRGGGSVGESRGGYSGYGSRRGPGATGELPPDQGESARKPKNSMPFLTISGERVIRNKLQSWSRDRSSRERLNSPDRSGFQPGNEEADANTQGDLPFITPSGDRMFRRKLRSWTGDERPSKRRSNSPVPNMSEPGGKEAALNYQENLPPITAAGNRTVKMTLKSFLEDQRLGAWTPSPPSHDGAKLEDKNASPSSHTTNSTMSSVQNVHNPDLFEFFENGELFERTDATIAEFSTAGDGINDNSQLWIRALVRLLALKENNFQGLLKAWKRAHLNAMISGATTDSIANLTARNLILAMEKTINQLLETSTENTKITVSSISRFCDIMKVMQQTLNFKPGAFVWICLCEAEFELVCFKDIIQAAGNTRILADIAENIAEIATLVARYNVLESMYQNWQGMSLHAEYEESLIDLCVKVLRFLDMILAGQFNHGRKDLMTSIREADAACRKFSVTIDTDRVTGDLEMRQDLETDDSDSSSDCDDNDAPHILDGLQGLVAEVERSKQTMGPT